MLNQPKTTLIVRLWLLLDNKVITIVFILLVLDQLVLRTRVGLLVLHLAVSIISLETVPLLVDYSGFHVLRVRH